MRNFWINLLAVVASYLVIGITIMVTFSLSYYILGVEGSYQEGSWNISITWVILSIVVGLGAAWLGGKVCTRIAGNFVAPKYLIALIAVLGVATAMTANPEEMESVREMAPPMFEAMRSSIQPIWLTWLNPFVGALGVAFGSGLLGLGSRKNSD